jgi:hypothetical protein
MGDQVTYNTLKTKVGYNNAGKRRRGIDKVRLLRARTLKCGMCHQPYEEPPATLVSEGGVDCPTGALGHCPACLEEVRVALAVLKAKPSTSPSPNVATHKYHVNGGHKEPTALRALRHQAEAEDALEDCKRARSRDGQGHYTRAAHRVAIPGHERTYRGSMP